MAKPNSLDLAKKKAELDKHLKKLKDPVTGDPKEKALLNLVLSAIRSAWAISPMKLAYYEMGRVADNDPSTPRKWKMKCESCKQWYNVDDIEVDHIKGNHSFKIVQDFPDYFENILNVNFSDMQRLCKYKCHRIKTHMEKQDLPSRYIAVVDKINIFLVKFSKNNTSYSSWLEENGLVPDSTIPKRRAQGYDFLLDKGIDEEYLMDFFEACDYIMRLNTKKTKGKRFTITKRDYIYINRFYQFWDDNRIHQPVLVFTVI